MFQKFITLEWRRFFRSSYWQRSLMLNILLGFGALYLLLLFLSAGVMLYFLLNKHFPNQDPLHLVNNYLLYWLIGDLIMRYIAQGLPQASVQSLLILAVQKSQISLYIWLKSTTSFWVWLPLMFFVPFAAVLWYQNYNHFYVLCWLSVIFGLVLTNNYLNYLINKNQNTLWFLVVVLLLLGASQYFNFVDLPRYFGHFLNQLKDSLWLVLVPFLTAVWTGYLVYCNIYNQLYLDAGMFDNRKQKTTLSDWRFFRRFGETGLYLNNELKLIWRNKRTKQMKQLLLLPLLGLFYIFGDVPDDKLVDKFVLPAFYIISALNFTYANYIPSWDSTYYPLLMTQKVNIRKYLESKWLFLSMTNLLLFILSTPYAFRSLRLFWLLFAVMMANIGFANLLLLWNSAYNTKRIDLDRKATFNTQGLSGRVFIAGMISLFIPMIILMTGFEYWGFYPSVLVLSGLGLIGILLKNPILNYISRLYLKRKYQTLQGFKQE